MDRYAGCLSIKGRKLYGAFNHTHPLTLEYELDYILAEAEAFSLINRSNLPI